MDFPNLRKSIIMRDTWLARPHFLYLSFFWEVGSQYKLLHKISQRGTRVETFWEVLRSSNLVGTSSLRARQIGSCHVGVGWDLVDGLAQVW